VPIPTEPPASRLFVISCQAPVPQSTVTEFCIQEAKSMASVTYCLSIVTKEWIHLETLTRNQISQKLSHRWETQNWIEYFIWGADIKGMWDLRFSRRWLWRMASSGMLLRVALVRTDVSEELSASFIRETRIGELGTLAVTSNRRTLRRNTSVYVGC
jgi:hypothetical protein